MKYKDIRKFQNHNYLDMVFIDPYAMLISPLFTKLFLKFRIIPNDVTILMILSGILGAIVFSINNIFVKIIGILFIHIWYILDCSDGEVARITKKFSMFGTEIDYLAHVVNHPLFCFSFMISLYSVYNNIIIIILFMILATLNLINRNIILFVYIFNIKNKSCNEKIFPKKSYFKKIVIYIIAIFINFPNFAIIFPIIFLVSSKYSLIYLIICVIFNIIFIPRSVIKFLMQIRKK